MPTAASTAVSSAPEHGRVEAVHLAAARADRLVAQPEAGEHVPRREDQDVAEGGLARRDGIDEQVRADDDGDDRPARPGPARPGRSPAAGRRSVPAGDGISAVPRGSAIRDDAGTAHRERAEAHQRRPPPRPDGEGGPRRVRRGRARQPHHVVDHDPADEHGSDEPRQPAPRRRPADPSSRPHQPAPVNHQGVPRHVVRLQQVAERPRHIVGGPYPTQHGLLARSG